MLPFANLTADSEHEWFAEGIAEEIIRTLSRSPSLFVIARNSCFTYKARAVDVRQVGRELGVRYVLEGSLRKLGKQLRITAELTEAETRNIVWTERYEISDLQDEITNAVTIAIVPTIARVELRRALRQPVESLDAWGLYQHGLWHLSRPNKVDNVLAQRFFRQAIDLDPGFAGGYRGLAIAVSEAATLFQTRTLAEAQRSGEALAKQAVSLDGDDAEARLVLSAALFWQGDHQGALAEAERVLAINPSLPSAHEWRGHALIFSGQPKRGLAAIETSLRLDPRAPNLLYPLTLTTMGFYFSTEYEATIAAAKRAIRSYPEFPNSYRWLAASLGQLGRAAEARQALAKAVAVAPASFDMYACNRVPWTRPDDYAQMLEGLRRAGWQH